MPKQTILTKKKNLIVQPPEDNPKPKPQPVTVEELQKQIAAQATTGATADRIGGGIGVTTATRNPNQTVTTGVLQPQFQKVQDIASNILNSNFTPDQLKEIQQGTDKTTLGGAVKLEMQNMEEARKAGDVFYPIKLFLQETKAILRTAGKSVGIGRFQNLLSVNELGESEYTKKVSQIIDAVNQGGDPIDAEASFRQMQNDLAEVSSRIQVESKYDIGALIDGRLTNDQKNILDTQKIINDARLKVANAINAKNIANIQATTRRQLQAGSENQAGLGA